jgi:hypothetical protein
MILNRYERTVARRYLLPGKGEGFIFLVASISLFAVALGVAALIIVMSVMNGFRAELFDKIVGLNGHAIIQGYDGRLADWQNIADQTKKLPGVTSALPLIEQPLMASANGRVEGVFVRGMRLQDIRNNPVITGHVLSGNIASVTPGSNRVAIGSRLAQNLGAYPGSEISLISPEGRSTPVGTVPRIVTYTVGAIFEVGIFEYDKAFDRGWYSPADCLVHGWRGLRGRNLRPRRTICRHADAGCPGPAHDGQRGRDGRGSDQRPGQGSADPVTPRAPAAEQGDRRRLAADELGLVRCA